MRYTQAQATHGAGFDLTISQLVSELAYKAVCAIERLFRIA